MIILITKTATTMRTAIIIIITIIKVKIILGKEYWLDILLS